MLSSSKVHKEAATEACWGREELAASASLSTAGLRAAVSDVEDSVGPRAFDQAACALEAVVAVVETAERGLWPREVCCFLLREAVRKCLVNIVSSHMVEGDRRPRSDGRRQQSRSRLRERGAGRVLSVHSR